MVDFIEMHSNEVFDIQYSYKWFRNEFFLTIASKERTWLKPRVTNEAKGEVGNAKEKEVLY